MAKRILQLALPLLLLTAIGQGMVPHLHPGELGSAASEAFESAVPNSAAESLALDAEACVACRSGSSLRLAIVCSDVSWQGSRGEVSQPHSPQVGALLPTRDPGTSPARAPPV